MSKLLTILAAALVVAGVSAAGYVYYTTSGPDRALPPVDGAAVASSSEDDGGEAILGGIDDSAYTGSIQYVPVRRKAYWEVELQKVALGNDDLDLENTGAAIDTGKSITFQPARLQLIAPRHFLDCSPHRHGRDAQRPDRCQEVLERPIHRRLC